MTDDLATATADVIADGAKALIDNANRLGLQWTLRPASVTNLNPLQVLVDGNTSSIAATTMLAQQFSFNQRVFVLIIPPAGNYVVGVITTPTPTGYAVNAFSGTFSTASPNFVNCSVPTLTFVKQYTSTPVMLFMSATAFCDTANVAEADFGLLMTPVISGVTGDFPICSIFINPVNTHCTCSGVLNAVGGGGNIPAGTYTVIARVRQTNVGTPTLFMNSDDRFSFEAREIFW